MGWSADETRAFVKLYLNHKCLWNIEDAGYRHKYKRTEAYLDISKKFQALYSVKLSETGVRGKINNLRSTYIQYLRKVRREGRSIESFSDLLWIKDMHECFSRVNIPRNFYDDKHEIEADSGNPPQKVWLTEETVEESDDQKSLNISPTDDEYVLTKEEFDNTNEPKIPCKTIRNYEVIDKEHEAETDTGNPPQKVWLTEETVEESDDQKNLNISPTDDEYVLTKEESNKTKVPKIPCKRKRKYKRTNCKSLRDSSTDQSRDDNIVKKTKDSEDEYDIYGKYIASQIRELGLQRALKVKLQIHNIVSEARLDSLSES